MFKDSFKYYKRKQPPPDLTKVIKISEESKDIEVISIPDYLKTKIDSNIYSGLKPKEKWRIYRIINKPGLIFVKNPFTSLGQRYWIARCLQDFSKKPHKLNLDAHHYLNENETWWQLCNSEDKRSKSLSTKLRWSTLGYHHNWDTKVYKETSRNHFPEDLAEMCKVIAEVLGFKKFKAEAAIVNYYFMNSTLSGHTDHSEKNLEAPLFSFSFGQSAIFLIGGLTENTPAIPIFIDSGDILIMSAESRLCYHAVPKILSIKTEPWNEVDEESKLEYNMDCELLFKCHDENFWNNFSKFIKGCRLNMNVRQVLKAGQTYLDDK